MTNNQMALHTFNGCNAASGTNQLGKAGTTNCNDTAGAGCTVVCLLIILGSEYGAD